MKTKPSRKQVLRRIADATLFGHLGLFVGTGFSMALTNQKAPNFGQLLRAVATQLGLSFNFDDPDELRGRDYPSIAAQLVKLLAQQTSRSRKSAERLLRREIAHICNLTPDEALRKSFSPVLIGLKPSWIITTNYDFILESIFEEAVSLLPNEALLPRRDHVPVYHLHGHRLVPESIVVTDQDYVELLGPLEYRQHKLSLLLAESTTLMLGYSLGDLNVRTAMQLARSYSEDQDLRLRSYEGVVVQALYVPKNPNPEPYRGTNNEIIIETSDLLSLLTEVNAAVQARRKSFRKARRVITSVLQDPKGPKKLVDDNELREAFIGALRAFPRSYQASHVVDCLRTALEPVWIAARKDQGFPYYNVFLSFILDVLGGIEVRLLHPIFIEYLAEGFSRIAQYLDPDGPKHVGNAYDATDTWRRRRSELPSDAVQMLNRFARNNHDTKMELILNDLE
jgi:hypothetical protein